MAKDKAKNDQFSPLTCRGRIMARLAELRTERASYIPDWREIADFIQPRRARFTITDVNRGDRRSQKIIDSSGTFAKRTLSSGLQSGITSSARQWFRLTTSDPDLAEVSEVKGWLHTVTQRMFTVLNRSNFYKSTSLLYDDLGTFGIGAIGVFKDEKKFIRTETYPIGSYMIGCDYTGKVDTFAREYQMKVRQIVKEFGLPKYAKTYDNIDWTNISDNVKTLWERRAYETMINVVYIIEPNFGVGGTYDGMSELSSNKRYKATMMELGIAEDKFLSVSGFDSFPIFAPCWSRTGEDTYPSEWPGRIAIGDVKALQHGERKGAQALDKMINPPLTAPLSARRARVSLLPGDVTYNDPRDPRMGVRPIHEVTISLRDLEYKLDQIRQRINRAFFADLFLMLTDNAGLDAGEKTATEIAERKEEKLLALGPLLESMNDDFLDPFVDRVFDIMDDFGLIPEPPEQIHGQVLKVEYLSIMAQAQKMVGLGGLERTAQFATQLATNAQDPSIMDKFDTDEAIDQHAEMTGIPPQIIRSDDAVKAMRDNRAKQQQAAQSAATLKDSSIAARNLSQANTTGDNALADMLRGAGSGAAATEIPGQAPPTPVSNAA